MKDIFSSSYLSDSDLPLSTKNSICTARYNAERFSIYSPLCSDYYTFPIEEAHFLYRNNKKILLVIYDPHIVLEAKIKKFGKYVNFKVKETSETLPKINQAGITSKNTIYSKGSILRLRMLDYLTTWHIEQICTD